MAPAKPLLTRERIDAVTASAYEIPTDAPEADGTLSWSATTLVIAEATGCGQRGLGYTYAHAAAASLVNDLLAGVVTGQELADIPGAHAAMVRAIRNLGRPGLVSCAISAVDCALWDLKARWLGLPLSQLLGAARTAVPIYGSGGFTTYDDARTREQLGHWVHELGIPRVKIKIGESWGTQVDRDLHRVAVSREVIGPDVELYVDANGAYSRKQALRVARAMAGYGVSWFEEPVSSDDLAGLRELRSQLEPDVAAGEYGYDLPYFARMIGAVDCLQIDVTRCGGITEWLRAAALAAAHNLQVSGHCAPNLHVPVAAAAANLRHLEYFHDHARIEGRFFDGALDPSGGVLQPAQDQPGHGLIFKHSDAQPYRVA